MVTPLSIRTFEESKGGGAKDEFSVGYIKFKVLVRQSGCSGQEYWFCSSEDLEFYLYFAPHSLCDLGYRIYLASLSLSSPPIH